MAKYSNGLEDRLNLTESAVTTLEKRYLAKDAYGKIIETGEQLFRRVARDISCGDAYFLEGLKERLSSGMSTEEVYGVCAGDLRISEREKEFFEVLKEGYFLPNSPTLMNAGRPLGQLSACFVLPIEDSMESIFEAKKNMALVHKSGGGTGFSYSRLRANGEMISSTVGYSPGPISFLFTFNEDAGQITQGGKRRGANMGVLRFNHPDSLCFAKVKQEEGVLKNFNLSLAVTDKEMEAIREGRYIKLESPQDGKGYTLENARNRAQEIIWGKNEVFRTSWRLSDDEIKMIDNYTGREIGKVDEGGVYISAKALFNELVQGAWGKGEPGIIFIDRMNEGNPTPELGEIESTNPCGEQPLLPYESCNLGSIDLSKMVLNGEVDKKLLRRTIETAVRFLDNVIERNKYPLKEIEEMTKGNRKIGLGIMGLAHMLSKEGIDYRSKAAIRRAEEIMKFVNETSKDASRKLAEERGAFPNFKQSIYKDKKPIRNATTTTIAPTGSIGVIAGSSQGIEAIYLLIAKRHVKKTLGADLVEVDKEFWSYMKRNGLDDKELLSRLVSEDEEISIDKLLIPKKIREEIKTLYPTAHDTPPEQHLAIQAAVQKHTDNAVSKTVNMPNHSSLEDVKEVLLAAHALGCKGVTIYRDGSRDEQLLTGIGGGTKKISMENPYEPPNILPSIKVKQTTPFGNMHVHFSLDPSNGYAPMETFATLGNAGSVESADLESIGRDASKWLRSGGSLDDIITSKLKIGSGITTVSRSGEVQSLPMGFAKACLKFQLARNLFPINDILQGKVNYTQLDAEVSDMIRRGDIKVNGQKVSSIPNSAYGERCPSCGGTLRFVEGCKMCICGFDACS
ncbi:MAG: adenosylcobalamin-dependent ribonucleoside-diphosphate reductase [archaeon]